MPKVPSIAIVVPAYNEAACIEECLRSCLNQTDPADELVIVDNKSTDATLELVRRIKRDYEGPTTIRVLTQTAEQGLVPTRNYGFARCKSDILGRIDADTILEPNWVEAVRGCFKDKDVMAASGPVLYHDMPLKKLGSRVDNRIRAALHRTAKDHRFLFGTNMAVRASAWQQIKTAIPADPNDEQHEDVSIALTMFNQGLEIAYASDMVAGMSARRIEDSPRDFYRYIMRYERTFKAHGVKSAHARIPIFIYLLIYFPIRTVRKFYDGETNRFTWQKLRDDMSQYFDRDRRAE